MRRVIIVYNPNSSQYIHAQNEVLLPASKLKGMMIGKFAVKKAPFETNQRELEKVLKDEDIVITAGGDATAAVVLNAIIKTQKNITFGALPYGNFNDLARTLGTMRPEKLLDYIQTSPNATSNDRRQTRYGIKKLHPLDIIIDGVHWRYAACYVTIGMTAESTRLFNEPEVRRYLKKGHRSSWRSYLQLAKWYFKNRHKKTFIPKFRLNGKLQNPRISDYLAVNGRSMSRVMKGSDDYLKPDTFKSGVEKTTNFPRLFIFMARSILSHVPGNKTRGDIIEFVEPATITVQAEGECKTFENVHQIEIKKTNHPVKTICGS